MTIPVGNRLRVGLLPVAMALLLAACATVNEPVGSPRKETLQVLTQDGTLFSVNAGQPRQVLSRKTVTGLEPGDVLVGLDYRVAKGVLYALSRAGRLYTLDTDNAKLKPVAAAPISVKLDGEVFGVDFNPVADRIRVVSNKGQSLRLHPDTGAVAATDPAVAYVAGDMQAGQAPDLAAAAYTYNKKDEKLTTNYAIDRRLGALVMQGSLEGTQPVVSPNTGQLKTIGLLGTGPLQEVSFDIADTTGAAFAAVRLAGERTTRLYAVDLANGRANLLGTLASGSPIVGAVVEP